MWRGAACRAAEGAPGAKQHPRREEEELLGGYNIAFPTLTDNRERKPGLRGRREGPGLGPGKDL